MSQTKSDLPDCQNHEHYLDNARFTVSMTIEIRRRHAVIFAILCLVQALGLWLTLTRSPYLAALPKTLWAYFFLMVPGSAFLATILITELFGALSKKH